MNFFKLIAAIATLVLMSSTLQAKTEGHILSLSATRSSLHFYDSVDDGYKANFTARVSYDHAFAGGFQFGADSYLSFFSGGHDFSLLVGPGYNFNHQDLENSFFVSCKFGFLMSDYGSDTDTDVDLILSGGKRFKIMEHVSYSPGIFIEKNFTYHSTGPSFTFEIVKFSLLF